MNTKLVTSVTVMVLVICLISHSSIGSAFALDAQGHDNKTKDKVNTTKDKTKPNLPHAMTKAELQKINREKQNQDESDKVAKDKAKAANLIKASHDKSKTDSKNKSKKKNSNNSKPVK
jgi:preprotein translocase subunit SecF